MKKSSLLCGYGIVALATFISLSKTIRPANAQTRINPNPRGAPRLISNAAMANPVRLAGFSHEDTAYLASLEKTEERLTELGRMGHAPYTLSIAALREIREGPKAKETRWLELVCLKPTAPIKAEEALRLAKAAGLRPPTALEMFHLRFSYLGIISTNRTYSLGDGTNGWLLVGNRAKTPLGTRNEFSLTDDLVPKTLGTNNLIAFVSRQVDK